MITYVNTVFVSNLGTVATSASNLTKGQFVFYDVDNHTYTLSENTDRFKIGMATGKVNKQVNPSTGTTTNVNEIKWSNVINVADIKNVSLSKYEDDTEDNVYIDLSGMKDIVGDTNKAKAGQRVIVRLTYKDLPTRFRKWTESYEYVTKENDTITTISSALVNLINKEWKRARVTATLGKVIFKSGTDEVSSFTSTGDLSTANGIKLTAITYDDDDSVDSINWYNKVRFNANMYWTDPSAEGWESLNKHFPKGVKIVKVPGKTYVASAKLVRDREAQAMGYQGILNRGEGTWPVIKPAMETQLTGQYDALTIEFENMYRAADDIFRKTKQTVEIYTKKDTGATIKAKLDDLTAATPWTETKPATAASSGD